MTFEMTCAICHEPYEAGPADIKRGHAWWALCPSCRTTDIDDQDGGTTV